MCYSHNVTKRGSVHKQARVSTGGHVAAARHSPDFVEAPSGFKFQRNHVICYFFVCIFFSFFLQNVGHYKSFVRCVPKQNTPLADLGNAFLHLHSTRFFTTTTQNNRRSRRGIGARHRRSPLVYEACPHPARGWGLAALPHRGIRLTTLDFGNTCAV